MDVLKHREEELLNWLLTQTTAQLFNFLSIAQPIDLSIQRSISFLLVNWLIDQINQLIKFPAPSDQSVITSCSKIWSLADLLVWFWINRLITSRLISCSNLFLLPRCRLRPLRLSAITKNCVRPSQSPLVDRLTISTVHFHFFNRYAHWERESDGIVLPSVCSINWKSRSSSSWSSICWSVILNDDPVDRCSVVC